MANLDFIKDIALILGGFVAVITFFTGVWQYVRQGHQARATHFIEMRRRFLDTSLFREILNLLATDDPKLKDVPIQDRRNFVGFLEEVALMVNSRLIRKEVAHYMFGYYAILVGKSENLWDGLDRGSTYWSLFRQFEASMKLMEGAGIPAVDLLRF